MARVRVEAFLLCDDVSIDRFSKTTVQGIFDRVVCESFPSTYPALVIFARLRFQRPGTCNVEFEVQAPSGTKELAAPQKVTSGDAVIAHLASKIGAVPLREAGRYVWSLIIDGAKAAEFHLTAELAAGRTQEALGPRVA